MALTVTTSLSSQLLTIDLDITVFICLLLLVLDRVDGQGPSSAAVDIRLINFLCHWVVGGVLHHLLLNLPGVVGARVHHIFRRKFSHFPGHHVCKVWVCTDLVHPHTTLTRVGLPGRCTKTTLKVGTQLGSLTEIIIIVFFFLCLTVK